SAPISWPNCSYGVVRRDCACSPDAASTTAAAAARKALGIGSPRGWVTRGPPYTVYGPAGRADGGREVLCARRIERVFPRVKEAARIRRIRAFPGDPHV